MHNYMPAKTKKSRKPSSRTRATARVAIYIHVPRDSAWGILFPIFWRTNVWRERGPLSRERHEKTQHNMKQPVTSRGCSRVFIFCALYRAYLEVKAMSVRGEAVQMPFRDSKVRGWLTKAKADCMTTAGLLLHDAMLGTPFDPSDSSTHWSRPVQFSTWFKNNMERRSKFKSLSVDATHQGATDERLRARATYAACIVALGTNIRAYFDRRRQRYDGGAVVEIAVPTPFRLNFSGNVVRHADRTDQQTAAMIVNEDENDAEMSVETTNTAPDFGAFSMSSNGGSSSSTRSTRSTRSIHSSSSSSSSTDSSGSSRMHSSDGSEMSNDYTGACDDDHPEFFFEEGREGINLYNDSTRDFCVSFTDSQLALIDEIISVAITGATSTPPPPLDQNPWAAFAPLLTNSQDNLPGEETML